MVEAPARSLRAGRKETSTRPWLGSTVGRPGMVGPHNLALVLVEAFPPSSEDVEHGPQLGYLCIAGRTAVATTKKRYTGDGI